MIYLLIISMLVFQGTLLKLIPLLNNFDEIVLILLTIIAIFKNLLNPYYRKIKFYKWEVRGIIFLIIFFIIGNISLIFGNIHSDYGFGFISGIQSIKALLIYFLARVCTYDIKLNKKSILRYDKFISIVLWGYFIVALLDIKFNFLAAAGYRNGIKNIEMGFSHPSTFEFFLISILIVRLLINIVISKSIPKNYNITLVQVVFLVLYAGKSKGIAFIALFLIFYFTVKKGIKFKVRYIVYLSPLVVLLTLDRIRVSLFSSEEARGVLYKTSVKIANDFFPFGSGFSTFGTDFSRIRYSKIYYDYGISNIWGLGADKPYFITDTQWAAILGETGYLGTIFYGLVLICICVVAIKIGKSSIEKLAFTSMLMYGVIASISDSILVSFRGAAIFLILAFFVSLKRNYEMDVSKKYINDIKL